MAKRLTVLGVAAVLLWMAPLEAGAQSDQDTSDVPTQLRDVEQQIDATNARRQDLEKTVGELVKETEDLSRRLIATAAKAQAREAEITAGEDRLTRLGTEEAEIQRDLFNRRDQLAELLAGLQRLEQDPPPPLAVRPEDALAALRGAMLLVAVVPELRAQADQLVLKLSRLSDLRAAIQREQAEITQNLSALQGERREIAHLLEQKQSLTQTISEELETERKRARTLAEKARSLKDLIAELEAARIAAEKARIEAERVRLETEQAEKAEQERQRKLQLAKFMKPEIAFSKAKGRLSFPAQGKRIRQFGGDDDLGGKVEGLSIATRQFAQVTAPSDGWVAYAGEFRGYGELLIINAGEGYHVLLAGMEKITVDVGQFVRAGEPVGTMGAQAVQSAVIGTQPESADPILYVEFRKNGNAIDPRPWWAGNDEKVRG